MSNAPKKSISQMVAMFENNNNTNNNKPKKPQLKKLITAPGKLKIYTQLQNKIILPAGGMPKYVAPEPKPKSPKYVHNNVQPIKEEKPIDYDKIRKNMDNMKQLLEKKGIHRAPFRIEPRMVREGSLLTACIVPPN